MFGKTHFYWFIPLLMAGVVIVAVILMDLQITSFRQSYFADLKAEIRKSDALTIEVFRSFLAENNPRKLQRLFRNRAENPTIVQIKAPGGVTIFETPDAPLCLREHLKRPKIRQLMCGPARDEVAIAYNRHHRAWMAYHSVRFRADGKEYVLIMAELCNSVSRIIRLSEFAMIALSSFGALTVFGLILYFFRLIRSPLNRLQVSTREIAAGNPDYPVFVPKSGAVREIAICVRDMAEHLKGQIAELRKLENCRGEFIAAISHAMKTPVTAILSAVEGIEQGALDDPEYSRECVKALKIQSQRLAGLLHDFLTLTALELQAMKPDRDFLPLSLNDLLGHVTVAFRNANPDVEISVRGEDEVEISGDPNLLEQALANLLNNAVQHGGAGRIELVLTRRDGVAELLVRDDGCGIAPEHLDKIFDRFYRLPAQNRSYVPGNGLGLAIVKHIISLHRGEISAASAPGKGTTFYLRLSL